VNRRRVLRRRIVVAVLLLLCVAMLTLYFRESDSGIVHGAQSAVLRVVAPLQNGTARATKPFRDAWNWTGDLFSAKSENAKLQKELENAQMKAMLAMQRDTTFPAGVQLVTARVVARSTTAWYSTVTINVGSGRGVEVYDPVINGAGLVGRVTKVDANAAQVTLITDQQSYVDAMVQPGGAQGIISGSVTGDVTLQYVDKNERVEVGQYVVTSGRQGSVFVRGIPIGQIESVGSQEVELYQSISLRPFVDFRKLDLVQVVVR
jgi:rod shape-determining protein MreC